MIGDGIAKNRDLQALRQLIPGAEGKRHTLVIIQNGETLDGGNRHKVFLEITKRSG